MAIQPALGQRVHDLRVTLGMSQARLGWPDMSDSYVSLIENGLRTPTPAIIKVLARKLGCTEVYLTSGVDSDTLTELSTSIEYAQLALGNGEAVEARIHFRSVLDHRSIADLPWLRRKADWGYAQALEAAGDLDTAIKVLQHIVADLPDLTPDTGRPVHVDDLDHFAHAYVALCRVLRLHGELTESIKVGEAALAELTETRPWRDSTVMLASTVLANYTHRGDFTYGLVLAKQLIKHAEQLGSHRALMAAYWNSAWVLHGRGDAEGAVRLTEKALAHLGELNDDRNLYGLHMAHARFLLDARPHEARKALEMLVYAQTAIRSSAATVTDLAKCHIHMARAHIVLAEPGEAVNRCRQALDDLGANSGPARAEALTVLGHAWTLTGNRDEAIGALLSAIPILEGMGASRSAAQAWYYLADVLHSAGDGEHELVALQHALTCMNL